MKKITILRYLVKFKKLLNRGVERLFKKKEKNVVFYNQRAIMELLFYSNGENLLTEESIKIYLSVKDKFIKELARRDKRADTEKEVISVFMNDNSSIIEEGKLVPITFQKKLEEQIL